MDEDYDERTYSFVARRMISPTEIESVGTVLTRANEDYTRSEAFYNFDEKFIVCPEDGPGIGKLAVFCTVTLNRLRTIHFGRQFNLYDAYYMDGMVAATYRQTERDDLPCIK